MDKHGYCRLLLKDARREAGNIPPINSAKQWDEHYAVFIGDDWYSEHNTCCAFFARAEAIIEFATCREER